MKHIAFAEETFQNDLSKMQDLTMPVYLDLIKYYGHRWWDTSTLSDFFKVELETYYLERIKQDSFPII